MERRQFLKYAAGGLSALVVGGKMPWIFEDEAYAAVEVHTLNFRITDAVKEMATFNTDANNIPATCYYWIFKEDHLPPDCPGPNVFAFQGDTINLILTNDLDEPHAFGISKGGEGPNGPTTFLFQTGPILPGQTKMFSFKAPAAGNYMYYDYLNAPVNRVMGLHGMFCSMYRPSSTTTGGRGRISTTPTSNKFTPYGAPTPNVQRLFNDFGTAPWWPGLACTRETPDRNRTRPTTGITSGCSTRRVPTSLRPWAIMHPARTSPQPIS